MSKAIRIVCAALLVLAAPALVLVSCTRPAPPADAGGPHPETATPPSSPDKGIRTTEEGEGMDWELSSSAFADGEAIGAEYTCSGENVSPPLSWTDPPDRTLQLALICDDPDAVSGTWVHWVLYGLPVDCRELPRAFPVSETVEAPIAAVQGRNGFRKIGYGGPCPPPGSPHRYFFRLYALSEAITLAPGATRGELDTAMANKVLAEAVLMGTFAR